MAETLDQLFVSLKQWVVAGVPEPSRDLVSALLCIAALIGVYGGLFAITTWLERKGLGRMQNRYGPNRVGPFGLLQPLADGLKALTKEDLVPSSADRVLHFLAPLALVVPVFLALAVIPVGRGMSLVDLDAGVLFFFAVGAATELSVFMAGWSSRNKYSLLGAMRAIAQMISYEVPLLLSTVPAVMLGGSLSPVKIVEAQSGFSGWIPHWNVLTPWGVAGFALFLVAAMAESNRSPFDLPEGESEIIAGYYIEYSGFKFALFFLGEYIGMFAACSLGVTLFLGGWGAPLKPLELVPSWAWFFLKLVALICLFIWIRGTLPRLRMDQLMGFAWKFMLPMALVNLLAAMLWRIIGPGGTRWAVCSAIIISAYLALARALAGNRSFGKRSYDFAG